MQPNGKNMSKTRKCIGKEGFERMNYLYQISKVMATNSSSNGQTIAPYFTNLMINISQKTCQRLDISVKRTICKCCRSLLLVGITAKVRIKKKKVVVTCNKCNQKKIYETKNGNYVPWTQKPESKVEVLDYAGGTMENE